MIYICHQYQAIVVRMSKKSLDLFAIAINEETFHQDFVKEEISKAYFLCTTCIWVFVMSIQEHYVVK